MSSSAADVVDDEDQRIIYTPPSNWMFTGHYSGYNVANGTIHYALAGLSTLSLNFTSDYIGANFLLLQTGGNFSVYLDGQISGPYSTAVDLPSQDGPALVFEQTGLDPNVEHNIQVEMIAPPSGWKSPIAGVSTASVNFDSFSLAKGATLAASGTSTENSNSNTSGSRTSTSVAGSPSTILTPAGAAPTSTSKMSTPVIVGAALGGLAGLLLLLAFVMIYRRRRKRHYEEAEAEKDGSVHSTATGRGRPSNSSNRHFPFKLTSNSSKPNLVVPFPNEMGSRTRLDANIDDGLRYEGTRSNHRAGRANRDVALRNGDNGRDTTSHDGESSTYTGIADDQIDSSGLSSFGPNANGRRNEPLSAVSPYMSEKQQHNHQNQHRSLPSMDSTPYTSSDTQTPTHSDGLHPSHPSREAPMASNASLLANNVVLRELIDLRAEVRRLTHQQATRSDASSVITDATPAMPPPLYGQ